MGILPFSISPVRIVGKFASKVIRDFIWQNQKRSRRSWARFVKSSPRNPVNVSAMKKFKNYSTTCWGGLSRHGLMVLERNSIRGFHRGKNGNDEVPARLSPI